MNVGEEIVTKFRALPLEEKLIIYNNFDSGWWHLGFNAFCGCPYFIIRAFTETAGN